MRNEPCSPARKVSTDRGIQNRCLALCDRHRCPPDPLSLRPGPRRAGAGLRRRRPEAGSCLSRRSRTTRPDLDVLQ
eukprot:6800887-Prymnesium_polylepis.3